MKKMAVGIVGINIKVTNKGKVNISNRILSRYNTAIVVRNKIQEVDTVLKWTTFDAGLRGIDYTLWSKANRAFEVYETGKHVEYMLAWMLGAFSAKTNDDFHVQMSDYLDHVKKADFLLIRNGKKSFIQVKFNNNKPFAVPSDVKLVRLGPPSTFEGGKFLDTDTGSSAFVKMLSESGIYDENELYDFFDEHRELNSIFNKLWRNLKY